MIEAPAKARDDAGVGAGAELGAGPAPGAAPVHFRALPVFSIAARALALPVLRLSDLVYFGAIPLALLLLTDAIGDVLVPIPWITARVMWTMLSHAAAVTPLAVAWTQMAVDGRDSIAGRERFHYGVVELKFLLAGAALIVICLGPSALLFQHLAQARREGDQVGYLLAGSATLLVLGVAAVVAIRSLFLFPAIATGRFEGIGPAWRQTRGYLERLAAVEAAICAPLLAIRIAANACWYKIFEPYSWISWGAWNLGGAILRLLWYITFAAAAAIAYRVLILEDKEQPSRG